MMTQNRLSFLALALVGIGFFLPIGYYEEDVVYWQDFSMAFFFCIAGIIGVLICQAWLKFKAQNLLWHILALSSLGAIAAGPIFLPVYELEMGRYASGFWLVVLGWLLFSWSLMQTMTNLSQGRLHDIIVPALFGVAMVYVWQAIVVGFAIPRVLLPAPTEIAAALHSEAPILLGDFQQTFLKSVIAGFTLGNLLGLLTALAIDRVPFLQRGLLPLGNLVSAVPIVGIAPIMVMWFGFGWESKTATIVIMIFFPMLINATAGLSAADAMQRDLMRSYGAGYWRTLFSLRLPAVLPFLFNALKINSTLALIGAIVAEFFGSPIAGMGFRISVEIARMNVDVVWATIVIAALAGSMTYGMLAALEKSLTFWHPSYRER